MAQTRRFIFHRATCRQILYAVHAPCLADASWTYAIETAVGRAAVYAPPDLVLPESGVLAEGEEGMPGWLHARLDLGLTEAVRQDGQVFNRRDAPAAIRRAAGVEVAPL